MVARLAVLDEVADALAARHDWHPIDAVVFPGGFLSAPDDAAAMSFIRKLKKHSPNVHLVLGVDNNGEQLALAFNRKGRAGLARKIFPVGEDVDGKIMPPIVLHEKDFADEKRIIHLANGSKALLCVCYDMFGLGDTMRGKADKLSKAPVVEDADGMMHDALSKKSILKRAFNAHRAMIQREKPDVALATIHRFEKPGQDIFWQRHGIATASAAMKGGKAVAAAHIGKLPENLQSMTLAANDVPTAHLEQGMKRKMRKMLPRRAFVMRGTGRGILRLF